jgi:hypothetical protein
MWYDPQEAAMSRAGDQDVRSQWQHDCTGKHYSYQDMARCVWNLPVTGCGPYAIVPSTRDGVAGPDRMVRLTFSCPNLDQHGNDDEIYKLMLSI